MNTIYIKEAFTGINQIMVRYWKAGQDADGNDAIAGQQWKTFPVNGEGVEHVYTLDMSGTYGASDIITRFAIGEAFNTVTNSNSKLVVSYIGKTNPQ